MFTRKMKIVLLLFVLFCLADNANATPRWRILDSGAIEWQIDGRLPYRRFPSCRRDRFPGQLQSIGPRRITFICID